MWYNLAWLKCSILDDSLARIYSSYQMDGKQAMLLENVPKIRWNEVRTIIYFIYFAETPVRHDRPPISRDGFLDMVAFSLTNYCRVPPW